MAIFSVLIGIRYGSMEPHKSWLLGNFDKSKFNQIELPPASDGSLHTKHSETHIGNFPNQRCGSIADNFHCIEIVGYTWAKQFWIWIRHYDRPSVCEIVRQKNILVLPESLRSSSFDIVFSSRSYSLAPRLWVILRCANYGIFCASVILRPQVELLRRRL